MDLDPNLFKDPDPIIVSNPDPIIGSNPDTEKKGSEYNFSTVKVEFSCF